MTDLYLIAHKVRGEPAFDIAVQMDCPMCQGWVCTECDDGIWWIIPTSGHRAYPWQSWDLDNLGADRDNGFDPDLADPMPEDWPDHYPHSAEPAKPKIDVSGLVAKKRSIPIRRRA